jgi:hypothetical protein
MNVGSCNPTSAKMVGRTSVCSDHVLLSIPLLRTPGPTRPSHVLLISAVSSPWFQAKTLPLGDGRATHGAEQFCAPAKKK